MSEFDLGFTSQWVSGLDHFICKAITIDFNMRRAVIGFHQASWRSQDNELGQVSVVMAKQGQKDLQQIPSGKHTKSHWKLPFIVDLPIKSGDCA